MLMIKGLERMAPGRFYYTVSDMSAPALDRIKAAFPDITISQSNNEIPVQTDIVFLALHPPVLLETLRQIKDEIPPNAFVVSLAPKVTLDQMCAAAGRRDTLARVIPNAPSVVNAGYNPVAFSTAVPGESKESILEFLSILGDVREVPEEQLESYAIVTAMGPTYLWFQMYKLLSLAESFGIPQENALEGIVSMMKGAAQTMVDCDLPPEEIMDLVAVKPLKEDEGVFASAYDDRLQALYARLKS